MNDRMRPTAMLLGLATMLIGMPVFAADVPGLPAVTATAGADGGTEYSLSIQVLLLMTALTLLPAALLAMTAFTRVIIVLGLLRQALGTGQTPTNQVLIGLALFLTFFIMMPTYQQVNEDALQPYVNEEIGGQEALARALVPIREFMFRQTRAEDLRLFLIISGGERPETPDDVGTLVLIPAFVVSEMTTAFMIGFIIYIPFLIVDMVVASTLMAMGMMMLPPIFISLPFKIIMFVLADGWALLIGDLVRGFE